MMTWPSTIPPSNKCFRLYQGRYIQSYIVPVPLSSLVQELPTKYLFFSSYSKIQTAKLTKKCLEFQCITRLNRNKELPVLNLIRFSESKSIQHVRGAWRIRTV